jgi:dTDP-4-dehydrorhamnose reductase
MKILLLGKNGQVGWELQRALALPVAVDFDSAPPRRADFTQAGVDRMLSEVLASLGNDHA